MQKILLLIFLFTFTLTEAQSQSPDEKKLVLHKVSDAPVLDGKIDPVWSQADSISDFIQFQPYHNVEPTHPTVAKVLTTEDALYCIMICYDEYENIQQYTGSLDNFNGDVVSIMLDTFGDERTAYKLGVSATGVRSDSRLLDDARNRDYNWDGIWFAESEIYDWGFVVEMKIPYKSLQYDKTLTEWGLDFDRWRPADFEDIYWNYYEEAEGLRVSQFGKLDFNGFSPSVKGLNLEIYPVGIAKATYLGDDEYDIDADAGLDIFYNPSPQLTFLFTANPDFAQIEADPYNFNISRFESYFSERRPFFTEGAEVFNPSGKQRGTGFYSPMDIFYSRRIGRKLPNGDEVPLIFGSKGYGRYEDWEYGGFAALTGEKEYTDFSGTKQTEKRAYFGAARVKKQILGNSQIGVLAVTKQYEGGHNSVIDIDGAFRGDDWQLSYQLAQSFTNDKSGSSFGSGYVQFTDKWMNLIRTRYVGTGFDVSEIGFVPWIGTWNTVALTGPRMYFNEGYIKQILIYGGFWTDWEDIDNYTDHGASFGYNMQFRDNWGFEINLDYGKNRDAGVEFDSYSANLSSWYNIDPGWSANLGGQYSKRYNFSRDYLANFASIYTGFNWRAMDIMSLGTDANMYVEYNPGNEVENIVYNARPYISVTPINDLNIRVYVDNVYVTETDRMEQVIFGLLFGYQFSPKSWIYFALNDFYDRSTYTQNGVTKTNELHLEDRAAVLKVKYLYYF